MHPSHTRGAAAPESTAARRIRSAQLVRTLEDAGVSELAATDGMITAHHPAGLYVTLTCFPEVWRMTISGPRFAAGPQNLRSIEDLVTALDAGVDAVQAGRR